MLVNNEKTFMMPSIPAIGDLYINEILFNPNTGGVDFIELYNGSTKAFDASKISICEQSITDPSLSVEQATIANNGFLILPNQYICVSSNDAIVKQKYKTTQPNNFVNTSSMPNYDDNESIVAIKNNMNVILDMVHYFDDWHYQLLNSNDGVSLEKINPTALSNNKQSWASAAASVGFATPGYQNSMLLNNTNNDETLQASPSVFSPDGDAINDLVTFQYNLDQPGYQANVFVYDASGMRIKYLVENQTLTQSGFFTWDGVDDRGERAPIGNYAVVMQYQINNDKSKKANSTCAIAAKW
jgi:hypothetical protein